MPTIATRNVRHKTWGSGTKLGELIPAPPTSLYGLWLGVRAAWTLPLGRWLAYACGPWLFLTGSLSGALLMGSVSLALYFEVWVRWRRRAEGSAGFRRRDALRELLRRTTLARRWGQTCERTGLTSPSGRPLRLRKVRATGDGGLKAKVAPGRSYVTLEQVLKVTHTLRQFIGCRDVIVEETGSGLAVMRFYWTDALGRLLSLAQLPRAPKGQFAYGVQHDGTVAALEYKYSVLTGGMTRQGKSNFVWAALASLLRDGIPIALYVSDTKGVEFAKFERLERESGGLLTLRGYAQDTPETAKMVTAVEKAMSARTAWMRERGLEEILEPTRENPLVITILDEFLDNTQLIKAGQEGALGRLCRKGSAALYVTWALAQDARGNVVGDVRELFPQRLCFRVRTPQMADAVLGQGAVSIGAEAHRISRVGVGYALSNSQAQPLAFRAPLVTPEQKQTIAQGRVPKGMLSSDSTKEPDAAVYVFRNSENVITYVGKSVDPDRRIAEHRLKSPWYADDVDESKTRKKWCGSVTAALQQETILIGLHEPKNNHQQNPSSYRRMMNRLPGRKPTPDPEQGKPKVGAAA